MPPSLGTRVGGALDSDQPVPVGGRFLRRLMQVKGPGVSGHRVASFAQRRTFTGVQKMKALVYHGPGEKSLDERPLPKLVTATDAIVRVTRTTICGTDLHILRGDVPTCQPGRVL